MGLLNFLKHRKTPKRRPREDLPPEVSEVVRNLERVKDPETELNIVEEGLLYGLTVKEENVEVFLLMARSTPECHACQMLAVNVQSKILNDIVSVLKQEGFNKIKVYNEIGLLLAEGLFMVPPELDEGLSIERVKDFSLEELLGMAIKAEIGARKFYESLAERIEIETLKEKIEWLAGEESKHEALLRKMYASMFPGKEVVYPAEHIGPELKPVARELQSVQDIVDLIRWAMRAEEIAAHFYEEIERMVDAEDRKRLMRYLSDMEKGHYYTLRAEYELLLDWEMYSQMMHVGP